MFLKCLALIINLILLPAQETQQLLHSTTTQYISLSVKKNNLFPPDTSSKDEHFPVDDSMLSGTDSSKVCGLFYFFNL